MNTKGNLKPQKFVLTGGPGVGKSTIIDLLEKEGFPICGEGARDIITEQLKTNGKCLPWINMREFQKRVQERQRYNEYRTQIEAKVFLDRGFHDSIAYHLEASPTVPNEYLESSRRANYSLVFLLDPLPNYVNDHVRKETPAKAKAMHDSIARVYSEFGCKIINIPAVSPKERLDLIIKYSKD